MLIALLVVLSLDFKLNVDEINAATIVSTLALDSRVAMLTVKGGQNSPHVDLYIVNCDSGKVRIIEDGRIHNTTKSRVFANRQGFVILERSGKMVYNLTLDGDFVSSYRLDQQPQLSGQTVIMAQTYLDKESVALTYMDREERGRLFLAKLNLANKNLEVLNTSEGESGFWEYHEKAWYFVDDKTGQITLLGDAFQFAKVIRPAQKRFKLPLAPKVQQLLAAQGVSSDANLLEGYFLSDSKVKYWCCTYPEGWPKVKQKYSQIGFNKGKVTYENSATLSIANTKIGLLQFSMDTSEFSYLPASKTAARKTKN